MKRFKSIAINAYAVIAAAVFLDSLRYKFTNAPETQTIFGKLDAWAASFGAEGLFSQTGLFSQYVIGSAELIAASLLLIGILPQFKKLQAVGALVAAAVMTGAVSFHMFTPLGIDPNNDGGGLFIMAVTVWAGSVFTLLMRVGDILGILGAIGGAMRSDNPSSTSANNTSSKEWTSVEHASAN